MKHFIRLADFGAAGLLRAFDVAKVLEENTVAPLSGKSAALFFPASSLRTRMTFERGLYLLGGQSVLFPPETLDKRESARDVMGYLSNWACCVIARHNDIGKLNELASCAGIPVINAMTGINHPCEIASDLYAISRTRRDWRSLRYLFAGVAGNIGNTWREAADMLELDFAQCCPEGFEMENTPIYRDIYEAASGRDVLITDSLPSKAAARFGKCRVTRAALELLNTGGMFIPCPPFFRGEELSEDALMSPAFTGYGFKKSLILVHQAIILECLEVSI